MCLKTSMCLFNKATPAITPTSTHVDHVLLWLLLLQLSKDDAIFIFERVVRGHHVYKKVWTLTIGEILGLAREPANDHAGGRTGIT